MTLAQFLASFFIIFIGANILLVIGGIHLDADILFATAIHALAETGIIAAAFWCFEHIRFV